MMKPQERPLNGTGEPCTSTGLQVLHQFSFQPEVSLSFILTSLLIAAPLYCTICMQGILMDLGILAAMAVAVRVVAFLVLLFKVKKVNQ